MPKRPNILLIHSDSMDGRAMGCVGHPAAHTPALDALAARGTLFSRTYCPSPVCVPSRVATWTGQHVHRLGVWNNACGRPDDAETFLPRLAEAGYRVRSIGRDDRYAGEHGFALRLKAWTRSAGIGVPAGTQRPPRVVTEEGKAQRVREGDWRWLEEAMAWLSREGEGDRPFFLSLGLLNPHPGKGYRTSRFYLDRVDRRRVTVPPKEVAEHPVMRALRINKGYAELSEEEIVDLRHHYLGMVAEVDEQVGRLMAHLRSTGLDRSTVVIYFSDHGDMQWEHGQWRKLSMYESSVRVPLMMAGPGIEQGAVRAELRSLLDLYPTLLEIAGVEPRGRCDGLSLLGPVPEARAVFAQLHESLQPTGSFMVRQERWKCVHYPGYAPQLFDLAADPEEIHDLASSEPEVVSRLMATLRGTFDIEAIDQAAKAYDRRNFVAWRGLVGRGEYRRAMAEHFPAWGDGELEQIERWLAKAPPVSG